MLYVWFCTALVEKNCKLTCGILTRLYLDFKQVTLTTSFKFKYFIAHSFDRHFAH